jgi:hypothetical protein
MASLRTLVRDAAVAAACWTVVAGFAAMPISAATCALSAPSSVTVGATVTISGSGFPAGATVNIAMTINGGSPDRFTVQADGAGAITMQLTPETADIGQTTVDASVQGGCSATVGFEVLDPNATPRPKPTAAPAAAPTAAAAGEGNGPAPRTDTLSDIGALPSTGVPMGLVVAVIVFVIGFGGFLTTRPARRQ